MEGVSYPADSPSAQLMVWRQIGSAPRNTALIATDGERVAEACLISHDEEDERWYWADDFREMTEVLTHWMPLPAPPITNPVSGPLP